MGEGIYYLVQGFLRLFSPGIKRYIWPPLIINIALFGGLFYWLGHYYARFLHWLNFSLPSWLHFLHWLNGLFWLLFAIAALLILTYLFVLVANIISAPFNAFLAEKVLEKEGVNLINQYGLMAILHMIPKTLAREWQKARYYLPRLTLSLIIFLIPGINAFAPFIWFVFGSWLMALQYLDYPFDSRKVEFPKMYQSMKRRPFLCLGFGLGVSVAALIPILNLLVIPAAVIGASLLFADTWAKKQAMTQSHDSI